MAKGKQYKNVYTILEKVKKGEISQNNYYRDREGLFGKLNFYKKSDLIKPHMHYIDEGKLSKLIDQEVENMNNIQKYFNKFAKTAAFGRMPDDRKPDLNKFHEKFMENYKKLPKSLQYDVQKLYYHKMDRLEFEERTDKNQTRFKFLEKANNPVGKIMTEGSNLKSAVFTKNMMLYYLLQLTQMEYVDPAAHQNMMNSLSGEGGGGDPKQSDKDMNNHMDNKAGNNMLDELMNDAQQTAKMMDQHIDKDIQEQMFDNAFRGGGGRDAGKLSPDYIRTIAEHLESVKLSMGSLKEKIKKLLDKSTSYFSSREIVKFEDLFNADDVSGLDDHVLLHPKLRKIFLEDIMVKETKKVGKIDVYVDISGSMSSGCGVRNTKGQMISKIDFAKSIIAKLKELDILNDVYLFNTSVKKYRNDLISISMIDCDGGTTIDAAMRSIEKNQNNALVITDAEDHCSIFSHKAFFIGVEGARFTSFNKDVVKEYSNRGQMVVFDGNRIYNVDKDGYTVR